MAQSSQVEELISRFSVDDKYTASVRKMSAATKDLNNAITPGGGLGFDGFISGLKLAVSELDSATPILQEIVAILKSFFIAGAAAGAVLVAFGLYAMTTAADLEALRLGLAAYSATTAEFEKNLRRLREVARMPGLGFAEAIESSTNLQAAGFNARLAERTLLGFGNALALIGKGKADLDGVILALSQIATKGQISAEEINQIAERVPQIRQVMMRAFGTGNPEQISKMGIGSQEFILKIIDALEMLPKAMGAAKNSAENFADVFNRVISQIGDSLNKRFLPSADRIVSFFDYLEERRIFGNIADDLGGLLGDMKEFEDLLLSITAITIAGLEHIPEFVDLVAKAIEQNAKQLSRLFNDIIGLINALINSYVQFTKGPIAKLLGLKQQKDFAGIKLPEFSLDNQSRAEWDDLFGRLGGRAKELLDGFRDWKPSNEVANDPSKGGFTFESQDNLRRIASSTAATAQNTSIMKDLTSMILGGGRKSPISEVELAGIRRSNRSTGSGRALRAMIGDFANAIYQAGYDSAVDAMIARQRGR